MSKTTEFRTCPTTGLKVDLTAEKLIKANAVVAVVFLAIGGLFGLLVALTRWPAVHFLPADWFYLALTAHGFDVLLVWIIFFEIAVLYFASCGSFSSRSPCCISRRPFCSAAASPRPGGRGPGSRSC